MMTVPDWVPGGPAKRSRLGAISDQVPEKKARPIEAYPVGKRPAEALEQKRRKKGRNDDEDVQYALVSSRMYCLPSYLSTDGRLLDLIRPVSTGRELIVYQPTPSVGELVHQVHDHEQTPDHMLDDQEQTLDPMSDGE